MGFFSAVKRFFTGGNAAEEKKQEQPVEEVKAEVQEEAGEVAEASEAPAPAEEPAKAKAELEAAPAEAPAEEVKEEPAAPALSATAIPVEKPTAAPASAIDPEEEALFPCPSPGRAQALRMAFRCSERRGRGRRSLVEASRLPAPRAGNACRRSPGLHG